MQLSVDATWHEKLKGKGERESRQMERAGMRRVGRGVKQEEGWRGRERREGWERQGKGGREQGKQNVFWKRREENGERWGECKGKWVGAEVGNRVARERKGRGGGGLGARGGGRKCEEQGEERKGDESARREGRERESGKYFKQCF